MTLAIIWKVHDMNMEKHQDIITKNINPSFRFLHHIKGPTFSIQIMDKKDSYRNQYDIELCW